ncbi:MAG: RsmB/NOP family class I SAM-dependent RNA methyltransferase [Nanobdellota archaeon]
MELKTDFEPRNKLQHNLVPIKIQNMPEFKEKFIERYSFLREDYKKFMKYTLSYLNRSLRVNTTKITPEELKKRLQLKGWYLEQIPWCEQGFWAEHKQGRRDLGNTIEHQLGYFYIQEAASMIPPIALNPKEGELVLDMCASPGSKASQIAEIMNNTGIVVANDMTGARMAPLGANMQRLGLTNIVQIQNDAMQIPNEKIFDKILLDAPCSGTGTIRKSIKTINMWNPKSIIKISRTQKKLLEKAWKLLKEGGELVYSTCSTEPEENEAVISSFIEDNDDAEIIYFQMEGFKRSEPLKEWEGKKFSENIGKTLRVWPEDNDTEGFYVAKLRKNV